MLKNVKNHINKMKIKYEVNIAKGMVADIMKKADWNENNLTIEDQYRLQELSTAIRQYEDIYNLK